MRPEPPDVLDQLRVLVVDDSPSDRMMAVRVLKRAFPGIHLEQVETEEQWLRALGQERFDAVLVDYQLPWTTGLILLHELQRRWPGIPVIMLTGTAEEWQALQAVQEGLEEYLTKTPESYALLPRSMRFALQRTRQRQALLESNETLRLVIEGVYGHAIFLLDAQHRIASWNPGAELLTGYTEAAALGRFFCDLIVPEPLRDEATTQLLRAEQQGNFSGENWRMRRDGTRFWADSTVSALHKEGGALRGFVMVLRDTTERRLMEEEQQRAAEFRERLLGIVSHDLRSPLQAITLQAQLLARQVPEPRVQNATLRINQGADRMTRMIADLLDFTRGRLGGGIPVDRRPGDLFALTAEVLEELQITSPNTALALRTLGNGQGDWDRDRLIQVVQNLVTNAMKHGAVGKPVQVALEGKPDGVQLSVRNQGQPIPPEFVPHLFDPFRRAGKGSDGASDPLSGLGLGLYIAQEIVRAHEGSITVQSDVEKGTLFTVWLPRHAQAPAAPPPPRDPSAPEESAPNKERP